MEQPAKLAADMKLVVGAEALGPLAKQLEAHLAADAMGAGDGGKGDAGRHRQWVSTSPGTNGAWLRLSRAKSRDMA
ncbi:hypothetical protein GCM10007925_13850 [Sphingomonas astaxanthinifaciens DSM 22298]|uniref:Uncharacterized protein n=1 Tax=Sphingomonas astaxanthinifaciens DSM 22298 TaxID=1123267 RepID=A0ABQ5Z6P5_9SPHN|nr:hypothetical protein GCM10007925_13850 [Sphingomonas astaxanthinifaciens DSM 22298]